MRPEKLDEWLLEAVQLMARDGLSLKQAAMELGKDLASKEAEVILRRPSFNKLLWEARYRWWNQLAQSPDFKKESVVGKLINLAEKLEAEGKFRDAATAIFQAAKAAGFLSDAPNVNIIGDLSSKDLEKIRETLKAEKGPSIN